MDEERDDIEFIENDEDGSEKGIQSKLKKLREKIASLEKEKQEYLDGWQRARADYANLQKSAEDDKKRLRGIIEEDFIHEITPVIDSFAMAMKNKEAWEKVDANWRMGVEYIYAQLIGVLKDRGFEMFGNEGELFDPSLHQAVSETTTVDESLDNKIATVLQQGYKLGDRIMRPARVSVYKLETIDR